MLFRDSGREVSGSKSADREGMIDFPNVEEGYIASLLMRADMFGVEGWKGSRQRCEHMIW